MKMMKTPGKFMIGIGLTAAAVAMTPVVKNMVNNKKLNNQVQTNSILDTIR